MGSHREDLNSFIPQKMYCDRRTFFLTLALILTFSAFEGEKGRPNGQEERRDGGMSNALKYLEELDKYYSQVARPSYDDPWSKSAFNTALKNQVVGKRDQNNSGNFLYNKQKTYQNRLRRAEEFAVETLKNLDSKYGHMSRPRFGKRATPNMYAKSPMDNIMFSPQGYDNYE